MFALAALVIWFFLKNKIEESGVVILGVSNLVRLV